jgi:hypothetical protein
MLFSNIPITANNKNRPRYSRSYYWCVFGVTNILQRMKETVLPHYGIVETIMQRYSPNISGFRMDKMNLKLANVLTKLRKIRIEILQQYETSKKKKNGDSESRIAKRLLKIKTITTITIQWFTMTEHYKRDPNKI